MDPEACLTEIRRLVDKIQYHQDHSLITADSEVATLAYELAEHAGALDEWIMRGGYLPPQWPRSAE